MSIFNIIRTKFHKFFFESKFFKARLLFSYIETATSLYHHGFVLLKGSDPF